MQGAGSEGKGKQVPVVDSGTPHLGTPHLATPHPWAPRPEETPVWPLSDGVGRVVFLLDVASGFEEALLRRWIVETNPDPSNGEAGVEILKIPCSRRPRGGIDPRLEATLAAGDDPLFAPLRVAWFPAVRDGRRTARWSDLLKLGDPRDPSRLRGWAKTRWPVFPTAARA